MRPFRLTRCLLTASFSAALVVAFGNVAAAAGATTAAKPGSIGLRLVDVPVAAQNDPRAQLYIVDHLAPGTVIHRRIEVTNTTSAVANVVLYSGGASIENGSFLGAAGHTPNDVSTWTTVSPNAYDVAAAGKLTATVTVAVPRDAAPGEQYGVVWAEVRSPAVADAGVTEVSRVGIRIYLSVGPGGSPAANFTITSLTAERGRDGEPRVVATVRNSGGRALDMNGTLQLLAGPGGLTAGPFPADLGTTLAIGDTEPVTILLDRRLPAGPWDAQIVLRSGLVEHRARATITFPDTGAAPPATTSAQSGNALLAVVGLTAALVCSIAGAVFVIRRRKRHSTGRPALEH
jgi:hypothetical protein